MAFWDGIAPLLILYFAGSLLVPFLVRRFSTRTFLIASLIPAIVLGWTIAHTPVAFAEGPNTLVEVYTWSNVLQLQVAFRLDPLSWLMLVIVNLVGFLILVYSSRYFSDTEPNLPTFIGAFLGFGASMSGLVLAEHTMMIYFFWELTTFCSFLLIGHHYGQARARASARKAILVTTTGSLSMFAGFIVLGLMPGGSFRVSALVRALSGATSELSAVPWNWAFAGMILVLIGAATKSALVPAHFWLPAAMVAPTPVSAFLHAAAMVKAGIYLLARMAPGFSSIHGISALVVAGGLATLLVGGYRSLRQTDLKLVLAYGTVSQLGLITAFLGFGTPGTYLAALALICAHATFKSALFLFTGVIEKKTGTRDLTQICGLGERAKLLATLVALAAVSMAGVPLSAGYLAKEAGLTALLESAGLLNPASGVGNLIGIDSWLAVFALLGIVLGSSLTVAYTLRYFWGAFAHKHARKSDCPHRQKTDPVAARLWIIPGFLSILTVALGFMPALFTRATAPLGNRSFPGNPAALHLWSGFTPFALTVLILGLGLLMFYYRPQIARFQRSAAFPKRWSAENLYERSLQRLEYYASAITSKFQTGSLPLDLTVVFSVALVAGVAATLAGVKLPSEVLIADSHGQIIIAIATIIATALTVFSRRRVHAVLALSATGAGIVAMFVLHGAPDLALTQLVVEAVTLVVFLLVVRRLPAVFSRRPEKAGTYLRAALAICLGLGIVFLGLVTMNSRIHEPVSSLLPYEGATFGGGNNLVNVVLVDVRAWDTVGEISVLLAAATGVTALVYLQALSKKLQEAPRSRRRSIRQQAHQRRQKVAAELSSPWTGRVWLAATSMLDPRRRSVVLEVSVRLLFHTLLLVSIWLLLIGHNSPGGGFAGGMVAGIALIIRYFAGGRWELEEAAPVNPGKVLGVGLFVAVASALAPALFGKSVLQSTLLDIDLGWLGQIHLSTAIGLDIGVYILVIGVVLDLLSALGAEIDRQGEYSGAQVPEIGFDDPHADEFEPTPIPVTIPDGTAAGGDA